MKTRICFFLALIAASARGAETAVDPVVAAVQKAGPAVVNISTEQVVQRFGSDPFEDLFRQFFGQPREGIHSLGSGVVVDSDGWLVTNYHVVRRASKINVTLADGVAYEARFVSGDEKNDLALLKIDPKQPLQFIELASERETLLGETVIAIGNPFGFDHTVTKGIISAKNRKFPPDEPKFEDVLQTDAAINPGNSGGPLINTRGELVGINTAILSQAEGIGFAIPAKRVANLLSEWLSPEKRSHLWLGLRLASEAGQIVVAEVQPDSPAATGGIQARDVIVSADGQRFPDVLQLQRYLLHKKAGDKVQFELASGRSAVVKLAALPKLSAVDLMLKKFGLSVQLMTDDLSGALGIPIAQGLLITDVQEDSPATEVGLRRGIVITHCAGEEIQSLDQLAEQLATVKTGEAVRLAVVISERHPGATFRQQGSVSLKAR